MLELLKNLWDRAVTEGGVVSGAPLLFSTAVIFLTALLGLTLWQAMDWRYSGIIANRDSTIGARDSQIGLQVTQIQDLEKRVEQLKNAAPQATIDPDAISQLGSIVGKGIGGQSDLGNGKYYFRAINGSGDFNRAANFSYRKLILKIQSDGGGTTVGFAGNVNRQLHDVVCEVIGRE